MKFAVCALALIPFVLAGCATPPTLQAAAPSIGTEASEQSALDERISYYARVYDVPESLIHRLIERESGYNPTTHTGRFWGLTQLRLDTAKSMGYRGSPRGLLDANTNLKYGVAYLSNAYLVSGSNPDRALALYASGYFYEARRKGLLDRLRTASGDR
jgi:soluble lytic murein transglycosylase-like protein